MSILSTCTGEVRPVYWDTARSLLCLIDQRVLPEVFVVVDVPTVDATIAAIKDMTVRGAPAIGAAGAFGLAIAARASGATTV